MGVVGASAEALELVLSSELALVSDQRSICCPC